MIPVLEFNELEDYVEHLRSEQQADWTHLEISHTSSERDAHGIRAVSFFAVATRRFYKPAEYIVVWACPILNTTSVHLQMDKHEPPGHQTRERISSNFAKVKFTIEGSGLQVKRGKWSSQPPEYLR